MAAGLVASASAGGRPLGPFPRTDEKFAALLGIHLALVLVIVPLADIFRARSIFSPPRAAARVRGSSFRRTFGKIAALAEKNARTVEKNHSTGHLNTRTGDLNTSTGHLNSPTARLNTRTGRLNTAVINKNSAPAKIHPALANFARAPAVRTRAPVAKNDALDETKLALAGFPARTGTCPSRFWWRGARLMGRAKEVKSRSDGRK